MALNFPPPPPAQFVQPDNRSVAWNWHSWFQQLQSLAGRLDKVLGDSGNVITVTISGTTNNIATISFSAEPANTVFAGPASGPNAVPTFRSLTTADLPTQTQNWPAVKKSIASNETCTIKSGFQLTLHYTFTISGVLNNSGELFIEDSFTPAPGFLVFSVPSNSGEWILL